MIIQFVGHSTTVINNNNDIVVTDPVVNPKIKILKRKTDAVLKDEIYYSASCILISHSHYDHLDIYTLSKFKKEIPVIVPWETGRIVRKAQLKEIYELKWWEEISISGLKILSLPAIHWSIRFFEWRGGWCSYLIMANYRNIYFAGDTAYGSHFSEIGKKFSVDLALLPIGALRPSFIMKRYHMNPDEAIKAFFELKAKFFIPIHWGAYRVALESEMEPIEVLKTHPLYDKKRMIVLKPGETIEL